VVALVVLEAGEVLLLWGWTLGRVVDEEFLGLLVELLFLFVGDKRVLL
jgi:hypothetical protein